MNPVFVSHINCRLPDSSRLIAEQLQPEPRARGLIQAHPQAGIRCHRALEQMDTR
jgi:hypothetical protein